MTLAKSSVENQDPPPSKTKIPTEGRNKTSEEPNETSEEPNHKSEEFPHSSLEKSSFLRGDCPISSGSPTLELSRKLYLIGSSASSIQSSCDQYQASKSYEITSRASQGGEGGDLLSTLFCTTFVSERLRWVPFHHTERICIGWCLCSRD